MKYNRILDSDRKRILEAHRNGEDWRPLAKTLGVNCKTTYRWLLNNKEKPAKKGGNFSKKNPDIINKMLSTVESNCLATLSDLKSMVLQEFGLSVCTSTIRNWLDGNLISVKNVRKTIDNMDNDENKIKRAAYVEQLIPETDGTFSLTKAQNTTLGLQDVAKSRFKGDIYFLQNGSSASAAAECLAMAKSNGLGTFIGQEAAGTYEGSNSGTFIQIELPNSKIGVTIPLVSYENAVTPPKEKGRGVIPDYISYLNIEDILSGYDRPIEKAKQLIRDKTKD